MGQLSEQTDASDWTELERAFFASAPPEVAVAPPPPATFDDLAPIAPARMRRRARTPRQRREPSWAAERLVSARDALRFASVLRVAMRGFAVRVGTFTREAGARAWGWTSARARLEARRLAPLMRAGWGALERRLGALRPRVGLDLPERLDGKSIVAALVVLTLVSGLSARVLGSRADARSGAAAIAAPTAPVAAQPAAPAATQAVASVVAQPAAPVVAQPAVSSETAPSIAPETAAPPTLASHQLRPVSHVHRPAAAVAKRHRVNLVSRAAKAPVRAPVVAH